MSISSYYQAIQGKIVQEVEVLEANALDGTETEDWVKYYMEKYAFVPIQLKSAAPVLEERVNKFKRAGSFGIERTVENSKAFGLIYLTQGRLSVTHFPLLSRPLADSQAGRSPYAS